MEEFKPVVFKLEDQEFGVDITLVQGIEKVERVIPVPNAPSYIKGIINLRGDIIPAFSLKRKFHMVDEQTSGVATYVVVKLDNIAIALEVDSVEEIHAVEKENLFDAPVIIKSKQTGYVDKVANMNGKIVILIDVKQLLTDDEQQELEELIKMQ